MNLIENYRKSISELCNIYTDKINPYLTEENKKIVGITTLLFGTLGMAIIYNKYFSEKKVPSFQTQAAPVSLLRKNRFSDQILESAENLDEKNNNPNRKLFDSKTDEVQ